MWLWWEKEAGNVQRLAYQSDRYCRPVIYIGLMCECFERLAGVWVELGYNWLHYGITGNLLGWDTDIWCVVCPPSDVRVWCEFVLHPPFVHSVSLYTWVDVVVQYCHIGESVPQELGMKTHWSWLSGLLSRQRYKETMDNILILPQAS